MYIEIFSRLFLFVFKNVRSRFFFFVFKSHRLSENVFRIFTVEKERMRIDWKWRLISGYIIVYTKQKRCFENVLQQHETLYQKEKKIKKEKSVKNFQPENLYLYFMCVWILFCFVLFFWNWFMIIAFFGAH